MKNKKTINFIPRMELFEFLKSNPVTSSSKIPNWYKKMSSTINKDKTSKTPELQSKMTLKMCQPFLDAFTCGYMITLPFDIHVNNSDDSLPKFSWGVNHKMIEHHEESQYPGFESLDIFDKTIYKFNPTHTIETPPGYSLLFTHPLNRIDLPFFTISGFVDTDGFNMIPVNLPFFIKKDFEGIIEKGTPIAQIIPIKRERWNHDIIKYNEEKNKFGFADLKSTIAKSYKNRWWNKKYYL